MENNKDNVSNNPELMESLNAVNTAKAAGWEKHRHVQEHLAEQAEKEKQGEHTKNSNDNVTNNPELMESLNAVNAAKAAGWETHHRLQHGNDNVSDNQHSAAGDNVSNNPAMMESLNAVNAAKAQCWEKHHNIQHANDNVSNNPELMESLNAVNAAKVQCWDTHRHVQEHLAKEAEKEKQDSKNQ